MMALDTSNVYQFEWSEKSKEQLKDVRAAYFRDDYIGHCLSVLKRNINHLSKSDRDLVRPDMRILFLAIDSAYLDLMHAEGSHNLDNGVSADKIGAALTCWINRLKPLHFSARMSAEDSPFLNSIFALEVGWGVKAVFAASKYYAQVPKDKATVMAADQVREMIKESKVGNDLIYTLMWRNPDFKYLSTLFSLLKP
jgi:hypothetical protein